MSTLVILKIGEGNFENDGFPVTLQISQDGELPSTEVTGRLPPSPQVSQCYEYWQSIYLRLDLGLRLEVPSAQVTNIAPLPDCREAAELVCKSLNQWLNSEGFRPIKEKFIQKLKPFEKIRILIQTENLQLQRLPWHLWELVTQDYTQAEIALSALEYDCLDIPSSKWIKNKINILAILGNSQGINIQKDKSFLERLPNAKIKFLVEPQRLDLNEELWKQSWDVIFFAGHSYSDQGYTRGKICINKTDHLNLNELKYALRKAAGMGLKLVIFNSCDGLGLAADLAELYIPQLIVMREPVPDQVAQFFLKYFLEAFANGQSFYSSVREARERLQGLEDKFPCASWLPVIFQNPAEIPFTWPKNSMKSWVKVVSVFLSSLAATGLVFGIRQIGGLERIEFKTYDQMMQLRFDEKEDARLLIVEATQADLNKYGFPLPDGILAEVLKKIAQHQPLVMGLDIYRNLPREPGHRDLVKQLQNDRLIVVCEGSQDKNPGIAPPPSVPEERQSFSDFVFDLDQILRRHLLVLDPNLNSLCLADHAFSLRLALDYLLAQSVTPAPTNIITINARKFIPLTMKPGGYRKTDLRGYQILLNYRSPKNVARRISLTKILTDPINPNFIRDRIVLIGVTAPISDIHLTPYGKMSGVEVHAQMTSQILSAVLDQRPLLQALPQWGDFLCIWGWSLMGGLLILLFPRRVHQAIAMIVVISIGSGISLILFIKGSWIPFVPSVLVLLMTGGVGIVYTALNNQ